MVINKNTSEYDWAKMLYEKCMLDRDDADYYAIKLVKHDLSIEDLPDLTQNVLKNVGISKMGHALAILKYSRIVRKELDRRSSPKRSRRTSVHSSDMSDYSRSPSPRRNRSISPKKPRSLRRSRSPRKSRSDREYKRDRSRRSRSRSRDSMEKRLRRLERLEKLEREEARRRRDRHYSRKSKSRSRSPPRARSISRSRSPSPARKPKRSRSNSKTKHHHIDRTSKGKNKLTDEDLLGSTIDLPSRFKSKSKSDSVLKRGTGEPAVKREFKGDAGMEAKLGLRKGEKDEEEAKEEDKYVYIKNQSRKYEKSSNGKIKVEVKGSVQKFKRAERPPTESSNSLEDRLGHHVSRSLDKRIVPKVDKHLATVEHKEGRYGKSQGMFSLDDILKHGNSSPPEKSRSPNKKQALIDRLGDYDGRKSAKNVHSRVGHINQSAKSRLG